MSTQLVKQAVGMGLGAAVLLGGSVAIAAPGDHIQAGNTEITPSLGLGMVYRTNIYRTDTNPRGGGFFRVSPQLDLLNDGPQSKVSLNGVYNLQKSLFINNPDGVSTELLKSQVLQQDRFNDFKAAFDADLLRSEVVGFDLYDKAELRNNPNDAVVNGENPFTTQFRNDVGGGIVFRPGPALEITPGGHYSYDKFMLPGQDSPRWSSDLNRNTFGPNLKVKWLFLPRTAMIVRGSYNMYRWDTATNNVNSDHFRGSIGLQGRISERLVLGTHLGYGAAAYGGTNVTGLDGFLANLSVGYQLTDTQKLSVGYTKDFTDSWFSNYTAYNYIFATWKSDWSEKLHSEVAYGIRLEKFAGGGNDRNDVLNRGRFGFGYDLAKWGELTLGASLTQRASTVDEVEWTDVATNLGIRVMY